MKTQALNQESRERRCARKRANNLKIKHLKKQFAAIEKKGDYCFSYAPFDSAENK
jgi:hypothetical protein